MATPINPLRGKIWYVDLEPTRGAEMRKTRPCVVVSRDGIGRLPIRLVVPLTGWQEAFGGAIWLVRVDATQETGLTKPSAADALQTRGVDISRFDGTRPVGTLPSAVVERIASAVTLLISGPPAA